MSAAYRGEYSITAPNEIRYSFIPFRGWVTVWTYKSQQSVIFTLADEFAISRAGANLEISQVDNSPIWQLVATFDYHNDPDNPKPEVPIDSWELIGSNIQKDLLEHPKSIGFGDDALSFITGWVKKVADNDPDVSILTQEDIEKQIQNHVTAIQQADAVKLFRLLIKGTTHYDVSQFVLRHTQTVSNTYASKFSLTNANTIYTTDQLTTEAGIPSGIVFDINSIEVPAFKDDYLWGWLKQAPQISLVAGAKVQMTQEYWLDQWTLFSYPVKV